MILAVNLKIFLIIKFEYRFCKSSLFVVINIAKFSNIFVCISVILSSRSHRGGRMICALSLLNLLITMVVPKVAMPSMRNANLKLIDRCFQVVMGNSMVICTGISDRVHHSLTEFRIRSAKSTLQKCIVRFCKNALEDACTENTCSQLFSPCFVIKP